MASNSFGKIFKITTWGESHGRAIGVVIDGCPAGIVLDEKDLNQALALRAPGRNAFTSPRRESDEAEMASGVFEGKTTGAPLCIVIANRDAGSSSYEPIKHLLRPGHAHYTYLQKYGTFDYRGGGRASARETACRVAAGVVAKKLLDQVGIRVHAYLQQVASVLAVVSSYQDLQERTYSSPVFCPDEAAASKIMEAIALAREQGDSVGGVVEFVALGVPPGLGDPIYEKLEARLAYAMMSLPASKGFELGSGFQGALMTGSQHNDPFVVDGEEIRTATNHAGGTLGGISTGMPLVGKVAFKPTSSIMKKQNTLDDNRQECVFALPISARHDPCVAVRAVPVVEAMVALVLADAVLIDRCARI